MNKTQLEEALRAAGGISKDRDLIVFGSQAILGLVPRPPRSCLISKEVDIYPKNNYQAVALLISKLGRRSSFAKRNSFFVDVVTPDLITVPDGWTERLVRFCTRNTGGVTGWCLEIHDLAVSKLAAGRDKDLKYIRTLLRHELLRSGTLENRIEDTPATPAGKQAMRARLTELLDDLSRKPRKTARCK